MRLSSKKLYGFGFGVISRESGGSFGDIAGFEKYTPSEMSELKGYSSKKLDASFDDLMFFTD